MVDDNRLHYLLNHFRNWKPVRGGWKACCPIHKAGGERNPSLKLWVDSSKREKLYLKCFACNAHYEELVNAVGLEWREMYLDYTPEERPALSDTAQSKRKVVAVYDYKDEKGELLYQVLRYEPKSFAQRQPCRAKAGGQCHYVVGEVCQGTKDGYHWALGVVRRVPYRLNEIVARPKEAVLVVEGEADADILAGHGFLATTNVGGCGMGWQSSYSGLMAGRRCVVIPDQDAMGLRRGWEIAGSLLAHGVASIRLVNLPAKDVAEYFKTATKEQFVAAIQATPEWGPLVLMP